MPRLVLDEPEKPRLVPDEPKKPKLVLDEEEPFEPPRFDAPTVADPQGLPSEGLEASIMPLSETRLPGPKKTGFVKSVTEEFQRPAKGAQYVPGIGGVVGAAENLLYLDAANRLSTDYDYSQPIREEQLMTGAMGIRPARYAKRAEDQKLIEDLIIRTEEQSRGYTFWGKAAKGFLNLPTWMAEFAMTGGLASLGKKAARDAGEKLIGRWAKTKAGQLALRGAGWTGGAITRATLGLAPRIAEKATQRQVGVQILGADKEGWATSFAKSWGDIVIESASEEAGRTITAIPAGLMKTTKFGRSFYNALQKNWMAATGGGAGEFAKKILTKGGYSNIIGEMGEEWLGTTLRAITDVDDFGAGKDADTVERLWAGLSGHAKNIGVEAVVLSAPMAGQVVLGQAGRFLGKKEGRISTEEEARQAKLKEDYERIRDEGGPLQMQKLRARLESERQMDADAAVAEMDAELAEIQRGAMEEAKTPPVKEKPEITAPEKAAEAEKARKPLPKQELTVEKEKYTELATQRGAFQKYKENIPDATEQELVRFMIEDGLRPPKAVLDRNSEMPEVQEIFAQDRTEEVARQAAKPATEGGVKTVFRAGDLEAKVSTPPDLEGIYFAQDEEMAQVFSGMGSEKVRQYTIKLKNPASEKIENEVAQELGVKSGVEPEAGVKYGLPAYTPSQAKAVAKELRERGYDGVIRDNGEVIVFDKKAIQPPAPAKPAADGRVGKISPDVFDDIQLPLQVDDFTTKRDIDRVNSIIQAYKEGNKAILEHPIAVMPDGKGGFRIIEGSHRAAAAKKLGVDLNYAVVAQDSTDLAGKSSTEIDEIAAKMFKQAQPPAPAKPQKAKEPDKYHDELKSKWGEGKFNEVFFDLAESGYNERFSEIDGDLAVLDDAGKWNEPETKKLRNEMYDIVDAELEKRATVDKKAEKTTKVKPPQKTIDEELADMKKAFSTRRRNRLIKETEKQIAESDIYQNELEALQMQPVSKGFYFINESARGEVEAIIGRRKGPGTKLQRMFTFDKNEKRIIKTPGGLAEIGPTAWDTAVQEALGRGKTGLDETSGHMDISDFVQAVVDDYRSDAVKGGLNITALEQTEKADDPFLIHQIEKLRMLRNGAMPEEIDAMTREWAAEYGIDEADIEDEFIGEEPKKLKEIKNLSGEEQETALEALARENVLKQERWEAKQAVNEVLAANDLEVEVETVEKIEPKKIQRDLLGKPIFTPATAGKTKELGIDKGEVSEKDVAINYELSQAVAELANQNITEPKEVAATLMEQKGWKSLFKNPSNPLPEVKTAVREAVEGRQLPFEVRGEPVGAAITTPAGKQVVLLAYGADSETGYHEGYHTLRNHLTKKDIGVLNRHFKNDTEAEARAFAEYARTGKTKVGYLRGIWRKLVEKLKKIKSALQGRGYRNIQDIFGEIRTGKVKKGEFLGAEVQFEERKAKPTITSGYPPIEYKFTGEWRREELGSQSRVARRNRAIVEVPVYKSEEGKTLLDMTQQVIIKKYRGKAQFETSGERMRRESERGARIRAEKERLKAKIKPKVSKARLNIQLHDYTPSLPKMGQELGAMGKRKPDRLKVKADVTATPKLGKEFEVAELPPSKLIEFRQTEFGPPPAANRRATKAELEENRRQQKRTGQAIRNLKQVAQSIGHSIEKRIASVSQRLANIDPELKRQVRKREERMAQRLHRDLKDREGFVKKSRKMSKDDWADFDYAAKVGDERKVSRIASKYNMTEDIKKVREILDGLYQGGIETGMKINYRKDLWPRRVKDLEGLLDALVTQYGRSNILSPYQAAIARRKQQAGGRELTNDEKAQVLNSLMRGFGKRVWLSTPGVTKTRTLWDMTPELNKYYYDVRQSLDRYIVDMHDAISAREFFGKTTENIQKLKAQRSRLATRLNKLQTRTGYKRTMTEPKYKEHISMARERFAKVNQDLNDLQDMSVQDSIGAYVFGMVANGQLSPKQEVRINQILEAYFQPKKMGRPTRYFKTAAYLTTIGSHLQALTQLKDYARIIYRAPLQTIPASARAWIPGLKSRYTMDELGIEATAVDIEGLSRVLDGVLTATSFRGIDRKMKEIYTDAVLSRYMRQAKKPRHLEEGSTFRERIEGHMGKDTERTIKLLRAGKKTELTKRLAFNEVLDMHPVARSELTEQYLRGGGTTKALYTLRTFGMKEFEYARREILGGIKKHPARNVGRLVWLAFTMALAGAGVETLRDLFRGRKPDLKDNVIDEWLRLILMSRYTVGIMKKEGPARGYLRSLLPPSKMIDAPVTDIIKGEIKESPRLIPVVGEPYYWWAGEGKRKEQEKREKEMGTIE